MPDRLQKKLKKEETAFLLVDIQERLLPSISGQDTIVQNAIRLLKAADVLKLPLIYTEQYPKGIGPTVSPLMENLPAQAIRFEKTAFSCCGESEFVNGLRETKRETIVVFGIETHICILSTITDLLKEGYKVVLASDACGSRNPDNHTTAVAAIRACGAVVVPTETIVYQLLERAGTPEFKALLPLFK